MIDLALRESCVEMHVENLKEGSIPDIGVFIGMVLVLHIKFRG